MIFLGSWFLRRDVLYKGNVTLAQYIISMGEIYPNNYFEDFFFFFFFFNQFKVADLLQVYKFIWWPFT